MVGIAVSCLTSVRVSVFKRCVECVVGSQVTRGMCGVVRRGCPLCLSHDVGMSHTKREVRVFVMWEVPCIRLCGLITSMFE